ncbi:DUF222 domain-containing protein, partial [Cryobacterium sp. TMT2-23]
GGRMPRAMSVGTRNVILMKPSFIEQQETRGEYFDAIREAHGKLAQDAAALADLIDEAHRFATGTANTAPRVPGSRWDADTVAEREFTSELACTIRIPQRSAETLIHESGCLTGELPLTMAALRSGQISYRHAQVLMGQAWSLPDEAKAAFEEALLKSAENLTASKLKRKARILRERLHPETITARHQKSASERNVFFEPEADGMASLHWYDSAEKVQAAYDRITVMGLSLLGPDEDRTLGRLRADVFKDLILDGVTPRGLGKGIRGRVHVTVPVLTLMGQSEEPGHLEGYGPIDPDTARRIAARAPSFTRILVHPETGVVLSVGRDRYKVPKDLRRYLEVRDETCRFPGCNR